MLSKNNPKVAAILLAFFVTSLRVRETCGASTTLTESQFGADEVNAHQRLQVPVTHVRKSSRVVVSARQGQLLAPLNM